MSLHTFARPCLPFSAHLNTQIRHATLLSRPKIPYSFTQLITLSDGSTYLTRTSSPAPIYRSTKDTRNHLLWQPSLSSLKNVEQDEAGRLRAFRMRFGRGWDLDGVEEDGEVVEEGKGDERVDEDSLIDLISGAAAGSAVGGKKRGVVEEDVQMVTVKVDGVLKKVPDTRADSRKK